MLVTLIGKNSMNKLVLPREVAGNYWLYDKNYDQSKRLINIESVGNNWQIKTTSRCRIINNKNIVINDNSIKVIRNGHELLEKIILKDYSFYYVTIGNSPEIYVLYCSPVYTDNYAHLHIENTSTIFIGKDRKSNHITYDNPLVCKTQAKISLINGVWSIENYDTKFNTFVNDEPISMSTRILVNGDRISIFGLTIILIDKELFINNPFNKVNCNGNYFSKSKYTNKLIKKYDEDNFEDYIKDNYFLRTPRILDLLDETEVKISAPQLSKKNSELPAALVLGSSLSMAMMTLITLVQTIDNLASGRTDLKSSIFSIVMSATMLLTSVLIPVLNRRYSVKIRELNEKDTIENYKKYIVKKMDSIEELLNRNRSILYRTYVSAEECMDIILYDHSRLWERQITDKDFLTIRLGIGDVPSNLKITYTQDDEVLEGSNETYDLMTECVEKAKLLKEAPVLVSLVKKNISAIIYQDEKQKYRYIQNILLQLITFHSYDELKLVFLLKDNTDKRWDFAKMLPHVWSNSKDMRFFADERTKISTVSDYLGDELKKRSKQYESKFSYKDNLPYYLIIVDDYKNVEDLEVINEILKQDKNMGFSILFLTDSILKLPTECQTFVEINENSGVLRESTNFNENKLEFKLNTSAIFSFEQISQILFNILIKYNEEKEMMLPSSYTFLEMYNVGCIEQLNILDRWRESDSVNSLSAPIGIDGYGKHIALDIHEKYHGPHGLIAGSTGSGKSEFIITYILSLAINYHPDDVTFVLIDYKGGGLAGAFQRPDVQLPHLVGTITNIDKSSLQRSLESIQSELKRRQVEFSEARIITGESTVDIYKYQKYYHSGVLKKPISHLFIISDEFAELKQQEPEFMDELISVARIGRSLGVHLILATQKPGGVVNDQIRSNSKFGVCLKVQSPSDSKDIIDIPDAAKLSGAGQFYLKVGNDDYLALGQSAWAGALYYPSDEVKKEYDNSIEFISSTGRILKKVDDVKKNSSDSRGEQLTNIVKYISDLAKKENIHETPLWLPPIPETIYLDAIRNKYNVQVEDDVINPVIGEYDDPSRQLQNVMALNLSYGGNTIIYGNAASGKETLISTMIYDIIANYSSAIAQLYLLDFGSETLKAFRKSKHVGDVMFSSDNEKIARFFVMLQNELKDRKEKLSDYNGDFNLYTKATNEIIPTFIIVLNNYESFVENYPNGYDEILEILLREGLKYRIVFVFTASTTTGVRYRMLQNFKQKIALQMNKDDDYMSIFERIGKKRPSRLFGRGLVNPEDKKYYEFQTAKICEAEAWNETVRQTIEERNSEETVEAQKIAVVPDFVAISHIEDAITDLGAVPVGIAHRTIKTLGLDLRKNLLYFMLANGLEDFSSFIMNLTEVIKSIRNINFVVLDAENILQGKQETIRDKYIEVFKSLNNAEKVKETLILIIGLDKFITELGSEDLFFESLKNAQALKKCHYVIIESAVKINNYTYSDWYKKFASSDTGLWLGNGAGEQYLFKPISSTFKFSNTCGQSYGYSFVKGRPTLVKLLGMKENGEENE